MAGIPLWAIAAVVLASACAFLVLDNSQLSSKVASLGAQAASLSQEKSALTSQNSQLQQSLAVSQQSLTETEAQLAASKQQSAALNASLSQKEGELVSMRAELLSEESKRGQLAQDFRSLQQDINSSMAWFSSNALFPVNYSASSSILAKRLESDCVEKGQFNLGCMSHVLENVGFGIHYRTDGAKGGNADHLQSLNETIDLGWGDCEDYSLLVKSLMNMLKRDLPSTTLLAWQPGGNTDFRVYPLESKSMATDSYYYYGGAHGAQLGSAGSFFPYVVCYNVNSASGHCVVALSQRKILSSQEAPLLLGAQVFEPQNGRYLGVVGSEFGVCGVGECSRSSGEIYLVIGDSDLYKHDGYAWSGYADYAEKVGAALN